MRESNFRGVIFDFNGVLWWDRDLQLQAWQQFTLQRCNRALSEDEMELHIFGRDNRYSLRYLLPDLNDRKLPELIEEKESLYRTLCLEAGARFQLSPGSEDLLDFLVQSDIPRGIATSSERRNVEFFIERMDLGRWFELETIVHTDSDQPGKPEPDLYLQAARQIDCATSACVVVEDSYSGVLAARRAEVGFVIGLIPPDLQELRQESMDVDQMIRSLIEFPRELLFEE